MAQGVETPPEVVAKFRALYLLNGNAAASAREMDIPERTGQEIAKRLQGESDFAEDRAELRANELRELANMRMEIARKARDRFAGEFDVEEQDNGKNVVIIDKRPDYGKLVLDAEKNAQNLAKIDAGNPAESAPITFNVVVKDDTEPSGDA